MPYGSYLHQTTLTSYRCSTDKKIDMRRPAVLNDRPLSAIAVTFAAMTRSVTVVVVVAVATLLLGLG